MAKFCAISKTEVRSLFTLSTDDEFLPVFVPLLKECGVELFQLPCEWSEEQNNAHWDVHRADWHVAVSSHKPPLEIDLVFGHKKVFVFATGEGVEMFNQLMGERFSF